MNTEKILVGPTLEQLTNHPDLPGFLEFAPRMPLPKPKTLARWRGKHPATRLSLALPPQAQVPFTAELMRWTKDAVEALRPEVIVLQTGPAVSPTRQNRERILVLLQSLQQTLPALPSGSPGVAWSPAGLWEYEEAAKLAATASAMAAYDPLQEQAAPAATGYLRVTALGTQSKLSDGALQAIASQTRIHTESAYVAIRSGRALMDVRRLQAVIGADA